MEPAAFCIAVSIVAIGGVGAAVGTAAVEIVAASRCGEPALRSLLPNGLIQHGYSSRIGAFATMTFAAIAAVDCR